MPHFIIDLYYDDPGYLSVKSCKVSLSCWIQRLPADMHTVSVMIWLYLVSSGTCSADAVTENNSTG
jgi:hypothetical protein